MKPWFPPNPNSLEEAKVSNFFIRDSILKALFLRGVTRGFEFGEILKLPFHLIDAEIRHLKENHLIGPVGGTGVGGTKGIDFGLTKTGRELAQGIYDRGRYLGPAPVALEDYYRSVSAQKLQTRGIRPKHVEWAFQDIVIPPGYLDKLGPALNSGGPIFIYGKPGNGKTMLSERLSRLFSQPVFVPHCIQIDGQIIQLFDEKVHRLYPLEQLPEAHPIKAVQPKIVDERWVCVYRPFIIVGGELSLEMLDLIYHSGQSAYEAPFQMKANSGVLLVDDFGRQIVKPKDFLNRWIFPLEKARDFLTLANGKKIEVPFDQVLIFSTNLQPHELADEAFWRRIKYKLEMPNPTADDFKKIFLNLCAKQKIEFNEDAYDYLIHTYYRTNQREFRAVHPRDIVNHMRDHISYKEWEARLSRELVDLSCQLYFGSVDTSTKQAWNS